MRRKVEIKQCSCESCQAYYSIKSLANRWDMSQKTIRRMIDQGRLRTKRIGGSIRIPHSEIVKAVHDY